jgi:hypothetical protein
MAGHQRTADTPADGGWADTPAGGGQADTGGGGAILRMGIHAYAMGEGRTRREPQCGGRERCINTNGFRFYSGVGIFNWYYLSSPPQILRRSMVDLESGGLIWCLCSRGRIRMNNTGIYIMAI